MSAFIPSPARGILHIGPIQLHAYGLMLAIGVLVAAKIANVRWRRSGHNPRVIAEIAVPVVVGGVIGARVYHLFRLPVVRGMGKYASPMRIARPQLARPLVAMCRP